MRSKTMLEEFFKSKKLLGIHCKTRYQAYKLYDESCKIYKKYFDHVPFYDTYWNLFRDKTIIYNTGLISKLQLDYINKLNPEKIYEFENIIFE